jgi:hypothetical protein
MAAGQSAQTGLIKAISKSRPNLGSHFRVWAFYPGYLIARPYVIVQGYGLVRPSISEWVDIWRIEGLLTQKLYRNGCIHSFLDRGLSSPGLDPSQTNKLEFGNLARVKGHQILYESLQVQPGGISVDKAW